jgi:hypothetical protein
VLKREMSEHSVCTEGNLLLPRVRRSVLYRHPKKEGDRKSHGGGRREKNDSATGIVRCWSRTIRRVLCGGLLALGTTKLLLATSTEVPGGTLLFGVQPHDLATLTLCITLLATTGLIAAYFPARRASRLDPMAVLREE